MKNASNILITTIIWQCQVPNKPDKHSITEAISMHPPALNIYHTAQHMLHDLGMPLICPKLKKKLEVMK